MEIKTPTEFYTFNSGILKIYESSGNDLGPVIKTAPFGERVVGIKRFYSAKAAGNDISKTVHISLDRTITAEHEAVILGTRYQIVQAQYITASNPPVTVLTLQRIGSISSEVI